MDLFTNKSVNDQVFVNGGAWPLHSYTAYTIPWCHYFIEWKPLLWPRFWSLLWRAMRPQFGLKRLRVCHVIRKVRIRPKVSISANTLCRSGRGDGLGGVCKSWSTVWSGEPTLLPSEVPLKILISFALRYGDSSWHWTWKRWRDGLVRKFFTAFRWGNVESSRPWSWLVGVNFNNLRAFIKCSHVTRCKEPLAVKFTSSIIKPLLEPKKKNVGFFRQNKKRESIHKNANLVLTLDFRGLCSGNLFSLLKERRARWDLIAFWALIRACMLWRVAVARFRTK